MESIFCLAVMVVVALFRYHRIQAHEWLLEYHKFSQMGTKGLKTLNKTYFYLHDTICLEDS